AFRSAFEAHAAQVLRSEDLVPVERADAVVGGDELGLELAEELERLGPFGTANPEVRLLVAGARLDDARPMGEEGRHVRFTVRSGGHRARAVAFGTGGRLPCPPGEPADATFVLEANEWNGAVEPRLVLRHARAVRPAKITLVGQHSDPLAAMLAAAGAEDPPGEEGWATEEAPPIASLSVPAPPHVRDRRGAGIAGTLMALVHSSEPVLALAADAALRARHLGSLAGGFALCDHAALAREPALADGQGHLVAVDPPPDATALAALLTPVAGRTTHLAWGDAELGFAAQIHEREHDLRAPLAAVYRALRDTPGAVGDQLEALLRGEGPRRRSPALAGRCLRVLCELELVHVDAVARRVELRPAQRTAAERSRAFRAATRRLEEGRAWLRPPIARAA
ncbi:MAG TPA: hypothetical protein VGV36_07700, partial [Solirubrobacteraceae bacterium]|nr:hypothetical protein [Solirubrobacteraceae bacterium]